MRTAAAAKCWMFTGLILLSASTVLAQESEQPPKADASGTSQQDLPPLEILMDRALHQSPDIAAARAELERAEIEFRRVQMETMQQLASLREQIAAMESMAEELRERASQGTAEYSDVRGAVAQLAEARAKLQYILGDTPGFELSQHSGPMEFIIANRTATRPEIPESQRKLMEMSVSVQFEDEPLESVLAFISDSFDVNIAVDPEVSDAPVDIHIADESLQNSFLALTDVVPHLAFLVRDYGLFATTKERAMAANAPAIPEDLPLRAAVPAGAAGRFHVKIGQPGHDGPRRSVENELEVTISTGDEGKIIYGFEAQTWQQDAAAALVDAIRKDYTDSHTVLIRPDDDVPSASLADLLEALKEAGIRQVAVATVPPRTAPENLHLDAPANPAQRRVMRELLFENPDRDQ